MAGIIQNLYFYFILFNFTSSKFKKWQLTDPSCVVLSWLGLDHSTRGLCSILLWGGVRLPSQLLYECHQSRYCTNSGRSRTVPDDRPFYCRLHSPWQLIYASSNRRCTLSTRRRCPSPAVPPRSSMASQCFTLTTAPMSSSRSTATWWSEPVAVTDRSSSLLWVLQIQRDSLKKEEAEGPDTRDDGLPVTEWALIWGLCLWPAAEPPMQY